MHRSIKFFGLTLVLLAFSVVGSAEEKPWDAINSGKSLYEQGRFGEARNQFLKASQIDPSNAGVFLMLGKSHYQLGEVEEAIAAWSKTVKLAPEEPFARRMLNILRGQVMDTDTRLHLVDVLIEEKLYTSASSEVNKLLGGKALTDQQRVTAMIQKAEISLYQKHYEGTCKLIQELRIKYPQLDNPAKTTLLLGRAKLLTGGEAEKEGIMHLRKAATEFAGTESGAEAGYYLLINELNRKIDRGLAKNLADWISVNKDHKNVSSARERLINVYLELTKRQGKPSADSVLGQWDKAALALVDDMIKSMVPGDSKTVISQILLGHFEKFYVKNGAYKAAVEGCRSFMKLPLSREDRRLALRNLGSFQMRQALAEISEKAKTDKLEDQKYPGILSETLATYETLHREFPDEPALSKQVYLAEELRKLGTAVPWSVNNAGPKILYKLAGQMAFDVIKAEGSENDVKEATRVIQRLVDGYVKKSLSEIKPSENSVLSEWDKEALALADKVIKSEVEGDLKSAICLILSGHFDKFYAKKGAYKAAIEGCKAMLKSPLPREHFCYTLRYLASYQMREAIGEISEKAKAGKLKDHKYPKILSETFATYETLHREFPQERVWDRLAYLAEEIRKAGDGTPWPINIDGAKTAYVWAVEIALDVIKADESEYAVRDAVRSINQIVTDLRKHEKPPVLNMSLDVQTRLLNVLKPTYSQWGACMLQQADTLAAYATAVFNENIKTGQLQANAKLNDYQIRLLKTLAELAIRQPLQSEAVLKKLNGHLGLCIKHGHYQAAEQAYVQLAISLPDAQRRQVILKIASLLKQQTENAHNRLLMAGLTVPRKLDDKLTRAQSLCHELQEGLAEDDPFLQQVRQVFNGIVEHYKKLEYYDIAEKALAVKSDKKAVAADIYTQLYTANLKLELAKKELARQLRQYRGKEKITLTPAFKTAIESHKKFIVDHIDNPLRSQSIASIFSIAEIFESYKAYDIAVEIYRDFTQFTIDIKTLWQAPSGSSSPRQRAFFAAAMALDSKAKSELAKVAAKRKGDAEMDDKISEEYNAALASYKDFIKNNPKSVLVAQAIRKMMAIAMEYARNDSWAAVDAVYLQLLNEELAIDHVERLEFCRGIAQLGNVMPDHARQLLSTLSLGKPPETPSRSNEPRADIAASGFASNSPKPSDRLALDKMLSDLSAPITIDEKFEDLDAKAAEISQEEDLRRNEMKVVAAITRHQANRAAQVAQLRESISRRPVQRRQQDGQQVLVAQSETQQTHPLTQGSFGFVQQSVVQAPVLSEAEVARQQKVLNAAYAIFQGIRTNYPRSVTADQARGEITIMISHWRTLNQWQHGIEMAKKFLADNPTDIELPQISLSIARDYLAWASQPVEGKPSRQQMLSEVARRYRLAREQLRTITSDFPDESQLQYQAQWDIANSFLTQARVVNEFSSTLARGQYVRAARELQDLAEEYNSHPNIASIPQMQWDISQELSSRGYYDEAVGVWHNLTILYPGHNLANQASMRIAETYLNNLRQPLQAAMAYQDVNVARGGNDVGIQNEIYQIGVQLKNEKRWVEALHVLGMFVDSFPRHGQAGQAINMIGQIHQVNEAWEDAIEAYQRVMTEFPKGNWVKDAKWAIAECTINLSQWRKAIASYHAYLNDYPSDSRKNEINRKVGILKDLVRYQTLVDEDGQRKAFDAQYQIADIVLKQLSNRVKAIIEFRKVAKNWPKSHLADDALYAVGTAYLDMGETDMARDALREVAKQYPGSPLADNALFMVGKSYEDEANRFATATRAQTVAQAKYIAQKKAYRNVQDANVKMRAKNKEMISSLKKGGSGKQAEILEARAAAGSNIFNAALIGNEALNASQYIEELTAEQMADRQDKINAALRKAVAVYEEASKIAGGDMAGDALQRMAVIFSERLKDPKAAMTAWLEIVRQFSGTAVAEDASWRIARYYERQGKYADSIEAYKSFLRNYRRSPKAGDAQFAIAENHEHLNQWVNAMDAYTNYINNFPKGPMIEKAKGQINWIKAYRL